MLKAILLDAGQSLLDAFSVSGRDLAEGKPSPAIFLLAARELRIEPAQCFVAEDAPAGIEAARSGGMTALGVARRGDATAALVSKEGSIYCLCWPRFDSGACFAALLGDASNGRWRIARLMVEARLMRRYRPTH